MEIPKHIKIPKYACMLGGSWGKFFMSDWSLTGPFWSLIAPESCSNVSLSIFYCRKVLQPIKDLCYKISLSDNIFMISKLDPAMFFFYFTWFVKNQNKQKADFADTAECSMKVIVILKRNVFALLFLVWITH